MKDSQDGGKGAHFVANRFEGFPFKVPRTHRLTNSVIDISGIRLGFCDKCQ